MLSEEKEKLGGENSIFLLPGLFIITETHILEGRAKKAEEYLTAAYWNFLKHSKVDEGKEQKSSAEEGPSKEYRCGDVGSTRSTRPTCTGRSRSCTC